VDLQIFPQNKRSQNSELTTEHQLDHDTFWGLIGHNNVPSIKDLIMRANG